MEGNLSLAFIFLSWETYTVKAQRWNKSVYIELALTPLNLCFKAYIFQNSFSRQKPKSG